MSAWLALLFVSISSISLLSPCGFLCLRGYFEQRSYSGAIGDGSGGHDSLQRKCKLNSNRLDTVNDAQEKTFLDLEELVPITRQDVSENLHVERRRAETKETHASRTRLEMPIFLQQAAYFVEGDLHLRHSGAVWQD